jgi:hypothetical protein
MGCGESEGVTWTTIGVQVAPFSCGTINKLTGVKGLSKKTTKEESLMRRSLVFFIILFGVSIFGYGPALGQSSNSALQRQIEQLENRLKGMEEMLRRYEQGEGTRTTPAPGDVGGVRGLEERLGALERIVEGVELSGTIEVEASYADMDYNDPATPDEESSDLELATAELGVDVGVTDDIKGHLLFLYEDDEDVVIDEAIIHFRADGVCEPGEMCVAPFPWYASVGKLYIPFGYFESHFISDPLTLELGETRETALVAGISAGWLNVAAGAFNGDVEETNESDNHIENYVATARLTLPPDTFEGLGLTAGVSYVNNIADSDNLEGDDGVGGALESVDDYVAGFSAFASASVMERFFLEAEYLGAMDDFEDGELAFGTGKLEPKTWNFEFAFAAAEDVTLAIKYEGSDDCGSLLPEEQYGAVVSYGLADNVALSVEYLTGEFENDDERDQLTSQLAIEW